MKDPPQSELVFLLHWQDYSAVCPVHSPVSGLHPATLISTWWHDQTPETSSHHAAVWGVGWGGGEGGSVEGGSGEARRRVMNADHCIQVCVQRRVQTLTRPDWTSEFQWRSFGTSDKLLSLVFIPWILPSTARSGQSLPQHPAHSQPQVEQRHVHIICSIIEKRKSVQLMHAVLPLNEPLLLPISLQAECIYAYLCIYMYSTYMHYTVWSNCYLVPIHINEDVEKIDCIQCRAVHFIFGDCWSAIPGSVKNLLIKHNLLPLPTTMTADPPSLCSLAVETMGGNVLKHHNPGRPWPIRLQTDNDSKTTTRAELSQSVKWATKKLTPT